MLCLAVYAHVSFSNCTYLWSSTHDDDELAVYRSSLGPVYVILVELLAKMLTGRSIAFSLLTGILGVGLGAHIISVSEEYYREYFVFSALSVAIGALTLISVPVMYALHRLSSELVRRFDLDAQACYRLAPQWRLHLISGR